MTAYALAFGALVLLGGLFGRKAPFIGGLVGFSIAAERAAPAVGAR